MNINVSLRRGPDGNLRPNMPNPTTPAEAKAFNDAMKTAKTADAILDQFTKQADEFKKLDNGEQDLNTDQGVVATSGRFDSQEARDALELSRVLTFNPSSGEVASLSGTYEGTVYRSTRREASHVGRDYSYRETENYSRGPLLAIECESLMSIPDDSSRFSKGTTRLQETSEGIFTYEVIEEEHNLYEK